MTSFVQIAGVYLVFSYLIVPAVCGAFLSARTAVRLAIGWVVVRWKLPGARHKTLT